MFLSFMCLSFKGQSYLHNFQVPGSLSSHSQLGITGAEITYFDSELDSN